jgi:hypothetical protein
MAGGCGRAFTAWGVPGQSYWRADLQGLRIKKHWKCRKAAGLGGGEGFYLWRHFGWRSEMQ